MVYLMILIYHAKDSMF